MILFNPVLILTLFLGSALFWLIQKEYRSIFLILLSVSISLFIQPFFTIYLLMTATIVFYLGKALSIKRFGTQSMLFSSALLLLQLIFFKYIKSNLFPWDLWFSTEMIQSLAVPLGISYLSFRLIAFVIDCYRGVITEHNLSKFLEYIFFFPIFPAGPIEVYQHYVSKEQNELDYETYLYSIKRLIIGYAKKVILVNFTLHIIMQEHFPGIVGDNKDFAQYESIEILSYLIIALLFSWLDLSSYADIAIGYSGLFGKKISENMNYPIFRRNLSDYWNNWHMTLSNWCRNYVYFPVMGKTRNGQLALFCSFIIMGLWHDISAKWFVWGLWHASGITFYGKWSRFKKKNKKLKKALKKIPEKLDFAIGNLITILYAALGFSFIMMPDLKSALKLLKELFI